MFDITGRRRFSVENQWVYCTCVRKKSKLAAFNPVGIGYWVKKACTVTLNSIQGCNNKL